MFLPIPQHTLHDNKLIVTFADMDLPQRSLSRMFRRFNHLYASARTVIEHRAPHLRLADDTMILGVKHLNAQGHIEYHFENPAQAYVLVYGGVSYDLHSN